MMKVIISIVFVITASYFGLSIYIASVLTIPSKSSVILDKLKIGNNVKDISFNAVDGKNISGWFFRGGNKKAIIFVQGAGNQNRTNIVYGTPEIAKYFIEKGYSVLLFDLRGTGNSEYSRISFGQYESLDVAAAFEYVKTLGFESKSIGIIGDSLGAISTIMTPQSIKDAGGIVLDTPAAVVRPIVSDIMVKEHYVPRFLHPGIYLAAKVLYKIDVDKVRPIDLIAEFKQAPLLFLHAGNDSLIAPSNSKILLDKVNKGEMVIFPNAAHVQTYKSNPKLYLQIVSRFFEENLK